MCYVSAIEYHLFINNVQCPRQFKVLMRNLKNAPMTNLGSHNPTQWTEISSSCIEIQTLCESPLHTNPTGADPQASVKLTI